MKETVTEPSHITENTTETGQRVSANAKTRGTNPPLHQDGQEGTTLMTPDKITNIHGVGAFIQG